MYASPASTIVAQEASPWPDVLSPALLDLVEHPAPFLAIDLGTVRERYWSLLSRVQRLEVFYAVKCNPTIEVLAMLASLGCGFEVASMGELEVLQTLGVDPAAVLYSNTVKPPSHIEAAAAAGLWRFAADAEGELRKIAAVAPGSSVYVRVRVDDSQSTFPLSRKFGAEPDTAVELLLRAAELGLQPYGVTFHVGSQCVTTSAWRQAIGAVGRIMAKLAERGVVLEMLDLGGGLPARYLDPVPGLEQVAGAVNTAVRELLPYRPELLAAEPGRFLVAESAVMATTVLGREVRAGEDWLYLDVGAYNGMMETTQTAGRWRYPLRTSPGRHDAAPLVPFTVTGPSCDSSDTMFVGEPLPSTLGVDDRLYIGSAGAYTLSYASSFNGFPPPTPIVLGDSAFAEPAVAAMW